MDKVTFFLNGNRVKIVGAGMHQKSLMLEYVLMWPDLVQLSMEYGDIIAEDRDNDFDCVRRFIQFLYDNTDPNDYDKSINIFLKDKA